MREHFLRGLTAISYAGFFSVGRDSFLRACDLGIKPATAFLVLARGSGRDNITTNWSAQAAAERAGMRWTSAKQAIQALVANGVVTEVKGGNRPQYALEHVGDDLWLPNAIVDGSPGDQIATPLSRIRQTQDPLLRLLVELYGEQNLREDGGIAPSVVWHTYEKSRLGEYGQYVIWTFERHNIWANFGYKATQPHKRSLTDEEEKRGENAGRDFFARFELLRAFRLIELVPYLFDGPEGEPLHPLNLDSLMRGEVRLFSSSYRAALRCVLDAQKRLLRETEDIPAIVPRHIEHPHVLGIYRLHYRPQTRLTGSWWIEHEELCRKYIAHYDAINPGGLEEPLYQR